jgi:hypothetical protein
MVYFQTKDPNVGKCLRALDLKMLIYFMAIWNILQTFGIFYDHLVHFFTVLASRARKPGNPGRKFDPKSVHMYIHTM